VLTELSCQIDSVDETMARFDARIQEIYGPFDEAVELLDTIPGVARRTAEMLVAEMGTDRTRFPSADPRASWAGVAPGNHESAGKRMSGKARKGNRCLRTTLVQAGPRRRAHERDVSPCAIPASGGKARQKACDFSRGSLDAGDGL
jgi:transposase